MVSEMVPPGRKKPWRSAGAFDVHYCRGWLCQPAADSSDEQVFFEHITNLRPSQPDDEIRVLSYALQRELSILADFGPPWLRCLLALRKKHWGDDYGVRYNPKFTKTEEGVDALAHNIGPSGKAGQLIEVGRAAFPLALVHPSEMPYGDHLSGGLRQTIV